MAKEKKLNLTLIRSPAGRLPSHRATVVALGLRRIRHTVQVADIPCMRGMIDKISYLLKVEEVK